MCEDPCSCAASKGHLALLQWARAQQCPWDEDTCSYAAAMNGLLELLKWARTKVGINTAASGHLELLKWTRAAHKCPWDKTRAHLLT